MAGKKYDWKNATLGEHTKSKHKILREYLAEYLRVRCPHLPYQKSFKLAIIDGFCGGALYNCDSPGSPAIILDTLNDVSAEINADRSIHELAPITISVLLILNDFDAEAIEICKENIRFRLESIRENNPFLVIDTKFFSNTFDETYHIAKERLLPGHGDNVFFILDQYGHSDINHEIISDILNSYGSPEILLTFAIQALINRLPHSNHPEVNRRLKPFNINERDSDILNQDFVDSDEWLGAAEHLVFHAFHMDEIYNSTFSIKNPKGWYYWLIHLAKSRRARQVYNDILHKHAGIQAHYGRSGLRMFAANPKYRDMQYLFAEDDRKRALDQLHDDIPKVLTDLGGEMLVGDFLAKVYNGTVAHYDDINKAMIENNYAEVVTIKDRERQFPHTIKPDDIIKMKKEPKLFSIPRSKKPDKSR